MKRMLRVFLAFCVACILLAPTVCAKSAVVDSGTWDDNLTWVLTEDGTLTISGRGTMNSYSYENFHEIYTFPWRKYSDRITTIVVEEGVKSIANNAFDYHYTNVKKVVLPTTLKSIGCYAFYCTGLTELIIPEGVTFIDEFAFAHCNQLPAVCLPDSLEQMGEYVFYSCDSLETVTLSDNITILPKCTFSECRKLRFLDIPRGVIEMGDCVFGACDRLEEVILPDSVKRIRSYQFSYCRNLKTVTIPAGVERIDGYAFDQCDSLEQVYFLGDAPALGENLFQNTTTTVYYPANNGTWTDDVMQQYGGQVTWVPCSGIPQIASGWTGTVRWTLTVDGVLRIFGTGNMKNYDYAAARPWEAYARNITDVVVEPGVAAIGECAFKGLTNLESVILPASGLTRIGEAAFYGCSSLKEIDIPNTVYTIQDYTFKNCTALADVRLSTVLVKVGQGAFENCTALDYIFIPGDTEIIGAWSFKGCAGLEEVDMEWADATEIREGAFKNCASLTEVIFPSNIRKLGDSCFYGIGATSFTIPSTVTEVGPWCFARAYSLEEIIFRGNAPKIGEGAFNKVTLTAYYPENNATWNADICLNYGGNVIWKAN